MYQSIIQLFYTNWVGQVKDEKDWGEKKKQQTENEKQNEDRWDEEEKEERRPERRRNRREENIQNNFSLKTLTLSSDAM